MEDTSAFEHDTFKNYDRKTQDEFIDFWIDKNYANDEEYNASDDETKKAFKNALADKYAKADSYEGVVDTAVGYTKDALLGASTNIDAYGASINKGLDTILPDSVSKTLGLKENQKFWNDRKKLNEEHIENKYAGMAGEIILDPVNLTPAGIASKGSKAVRIAKSAGLGVGVGGATMVAKNYGNDELTNKQKTDEVLMSAGVVSVLNGIIAGVTKGRVTGAIKDVSDDLVGSKSSKEVADEIVENADDLGLSKKEASEVATAVKTEKAFNAKEFLDKTKPPKLSSVDADGMVHIETQGTPAAKAEDELDQIDNGFDELVAEINNGEEALTPKGYKEPEIIPEPKVELTPEQHLQKLDDDVREANRVAEYKDSIGATDEATKLKEEAKLKADEALQIRTAKAEELLAHPRAEELLQMRKDVLAKDTKSPQILTQKGAGRELDGYGGENKNTYDKASYDKNYNYDFELTKNDVANLQAGKVDDTLLSKLETDLDTLDNNPDYKPTDNKSGIDYSYKEPDNQIDDIDIDIKKYLDEDNAFQTDFRNKYKFTPTGSTKMDDYLVNEYKNNKPKNMSSSDWEEANTLFSKGVDNVAVATYAGVEEDENGNITFSPEKFLLGLGGYTAVKAAIKNKQVQGKLKEYAQKAIDTVDMNPQVHKESGFNAMFVGARNNDKGAFSDVASKKVMKEIDDSGVKVTNGTWGTAEDIKRGNQTSAKLEDIFNHDELYKKYPELKDTSVVLVPDMKGASFDTKANRIEVGYDTKTKEIDKTSLLHEVQHSVQNIEGFARGGSSDTIVTKDLIDTIDAQYGYLPSIQKIEKEFLEGKIKTEEDMQVKIVNLFNDGAGGIDKLKFDTYQRLLGEQQARATQYRADMTPEQKASETWQDTLKRVEGEYKEPIVKFDGNGVQEHAINVGKNSDTSIEDVNTILDKSSKPYIHKSLSDSTWKQEFNLKNVTDDATVTDVLGNDITITHDQMKKMLGKSRGHYLGLIKPTLQDPTMILKHKDADVYISRFYDENMKKYNLFAVSKDYKTGKLTLTSIVQRRDSQIKNKILEGEVTYVKDHGSVDGTSSSRVTPPDQSADSLKTIIAQKKAKGYEHVRKIVSDESLKEWGDAANSFKRNFTDTLSKEYHDIREKVTAKTNGDTIKLERLHNALNEFNEVDRKAIHEFVAGVNKNIDKNLLPLATKMKDDIHALSKSLVDRGVLGEAEFKEWENNYIHRSYEKHFMKDIKTLLSKGFKLDEIHKRGKIEMLSAKKVKEFRDSVKPEIFKRPLKDGGFRLKELPNGKFELRRDWTTAEREAMGEITDGAITIPETLMKLEQLNNNAKFLQEIEELDGVVLANGKDYTAKELEDAGYAIVPKDVKYGVLSGKVIRHDVLNDIKGVKNELFNTFGNDGAMARVWKGYLSTWKKSKTVWNIPSHVNNFMSNAFLMHLAGMSAIEVTKSVGKAGKMMIHGNAYEELLKKKMLKTATAKNLKELEVMGEDLKYFIEAREGGLLGRSQLNDILAGQQNAPTKKGLLAGMDKFAQDAYHNGDAINRIAMYSHLRQKIKLEPDEARKMVLAVMPDYSKPMPAGYGWLRDSGVSPFISWTYYTMPTVIKMIRTKQGATQATKALATLSLLEWVLTGGEITPLDNVPFMDTKKPKDFKGRRFAISADKDKITTVKTDRWIPYVELLNPINFGISMFSGPTTKMVTNLGTLGSQNGMVDTYTGRPVTYASKSAGLRAYDYFKYLTQSYVPLPAQAYTGWNIGESMLKDKKKRKTNRVSTPRTPTQEALKFSGLNSLTYSKKGLKHEQRKDR